MRCEPARPMSANSRRNSGRAQILGGREEHAVRNLGPVGVRGRGQQLGVAILEGQWSCFSPVRGRIPPPKVPRQPSGQSGTKHG
eukprot:9262364-Pyramimonas_sp.AAC.1